MGKFVPLQRQTTFREMPVSTGDEYPDCDPDIFKNGTRVAVCAVGKRIVQEFCEVCQKDGMAVDWYFASGRRVPVLATTGDVEDVMRKWEAYVEKCRRNGTL